MDNSLTQGVVQLMLLTGEFYNVYLVQQSPRFIVTTYPERRGTARKLFPNEAAFFLVTDNTGSNRLVRMRFTEKQEMEPYGKISIFKIEAVEPRQSVREDFRVKCSIQTNVTLPEGIYNKIIVPVKILDISATGCFLKFSSPNLEKYLQPGKSLYLDIDTGMKILYVKCRIARIVEVIDSQNVGCQFIVDRDQTEVLGEITRFVLMMQVQKMQW